MKPAILAAGIVLCPRVAWAEVMDKEPTLSTLWIRLLALGVLGFFAWQRHWAPGIMATLIAAFVAARFHLALTDPYVGPAIRQEAGRGYMVQAYASMLICAALHVAGLVAFLRQRHLPGPADSPKGASQRTMHH